MTHSRPVSVESANPARTSDFVVTSTDVPQCGHSMLAMTPSLSDEPTESKSPTSGGDTDYDEPDPG
jgi:hypothetical protein